ncbi:MAG: transcription elongation factor GreA [Clostridiales Family XIII bacterium]|jgi:transcription elongation factor GreA|nr:transcription elongation factor GreA [Clostridiales Family XIII bacterium]
MNEEILLTQEGYDQKEAELEELTTVRRPEVAERLKEAISYGDISENAEYDSAKNEQAELEDKINKLEYLIRNAKIIEDDVNSKHDVVSLGHRVTVKNSKTKETQEYIIVGSSESDPFNGKISNESLVGAALLGGKVKQKVSVNVPDGVVKYEILSID